jgi:hypothetical protein
MARGLAVIACASLIAIVAASAQARDVQKVRYRATLGDHVALSGFCDFTVYATDTGTPPRVTETWVDGNLVRVDITPMGAVSTTLEANGTSFTAVNSGPVTYIFNDDGSITGYQRGPSWSADQGLLTGDAFFTQFYGRGVITAIPNPDTGFVDFASVSIVGNRTDICATLAP